MATRKAVERISARVFCHGPGGGNPVTVFASLLPLSSSTQARLAQECEWESVMVATQSNLSSSLDSDINNNNESRPPAEMAFYMPSGEEVSFCAHAALGGAYALAQRAGFSDMTIHVPMTGSSQTIHFPALESDETDTTPQKACLSMEAVLEEEPISHRPTLNRLLRDHLGISGADLVPSRGRVYPSFVNSSIARPKTLVHLNSVETLHRARTPKVATLPLSNDDATETDDSAPPPKRRNTFAMACAAIDDSTGIYLYANKPNEDGAWECRQFPRNSGYPEDPATGIAAAALAASLFNNSIYLPLYKLYQGTAMGRPSLIEVGDLRFSGATAAFSLQGKVEIDSRETVEVEDQ